MERRVQDAKGPKNCEKYSQAKEEDFLKTFVIMMKR